MGNHTEAIKNFDEIINRELAKPHGPGGSLVVAARTKKVSLERTNSKLSKAFLEEIIEKCRRHSHADQIIEDLVHIKEKE